MVLGVEWDQQREQARERLSEPRLYENFEALATVR